MALRDLSALYDELSSAVLSLPAEEILVPLVSKELIQNAFLTSGSRDYQSVVFQRSVTIFTANDGTVQYCPNQWFKLAEIGQRYVQALMEYKAYVGPVNAILKSNGLGDEHGEDLVLSYFRDARLATLPEEVSVAIDTVLTTAGRSSEDIVFFKRFVLNYAWWRGSKQIERHDFTASPILKLLNSVHVDNGFIMKIINRLGNNLLTMELIKVDLLSSRSGESTLLLGTSAVNSLSAPAQNLIIYGAPGTGKSYRANQLSQGYNVRTTTFHPEYGYADFIGSFRPFPLYSGRIGSDDEVSVTVLNEQLYDVVGNISRRGKPHIDYRFVPGDFLKILGEALMSEISGENRGFVLIIEELNRGNAAAIFGDFFQLLDRDINGQSKYSIANSDVLNYLFEFSEGRITGDHLYIPSNLSIYATMNSADQGVFPLDTAFKRRWNYEYLSIDYSGIQHSNTFIPYGGELIKFSTFMQTINENLALSLNIHEDKLLGPYFVSNEELTRQPFETTETVYIERLKNLVCNKILMYLWDDVARYKRSSIFKNSYTFGDIVNRYKNGEQIFTFDFPVVAQNDEADGEDDQ